MYKKLRKKVTLGTIALVLVLTVFAVLLQVFNEETWQYFITSKDIGEVITGNQIQDGDIYHGDINIILDYYGEDDEGSYYIMPVGKDKYMGLYLDDKYESDANKIMDDTYDYINGDTDTLSNQSIATKGMVSAMTADEQSYFKEWFETSGYAVAAGITDIDSVMVYYTYYDVPIREWLNGTDITYIVLSGILIVGALWALLWYVFGGYASKVKNTIKNKGLDYETVNQDILSGIERKTAMLGRNYIVCRTGAGFDLFVTQDIVWAYLYTHTTVHKLYGVINTGKTVEHSLCFTTRDRKQYKFKCKSDTAVIELLEQMDKMYSHILIGYNEELMSLYNYNFIEMLRLSEEKGQDLYKNI